MSKVLVTREKLDKLASIIGGKADVAVPLTIDGTIAAAETLGKGGAEPNLQTKSVSITPSESAQSRSVTPDTGYDGMDQVNVSVGAISSSYVGSGITRRSSSDLTASSATVTAPAGYYGSAASKTIPDATLGMAASNEYYTENGERKWRYRSVAYCDSQAYSNTNPGYVPNGFEQVSNFYTRNAIAKNTSVTPTESAQTIGGANTMMEGAVTVNAIPSNYIGSGITQRSSSDLTASGATVTAPAGYYGSAATKSVASGTARVPSSITGTSANMSAGTNQLTFSKTIALTPDVTAGYIASGTERNASVSLTANVTTKASATIHPSTSDQQIDAITFVTGNQIIKGVTTTNLLAENIKKDVVVKIGDSTDDDCVTSITGTYEGGGGGGSGVQVGTATGSLSGTQTISFTGLSGEPLSFAVVATSNITPDDLVDFAASIVYDGSGYHVQYISDSGGDQVKYKSTGVTSSYSNGTLTVTLSIGVEFAGSYKLTYSYGGTSSDIGTANVQVGSGATSITFSGLSGSPVYFSCTFKSTFGTSSGYQRVIGVVYDGTDIYGLEMDSTAKAASHWTYTVSGSSLTITSSGTNQGGYFHQPGYYQLTYAIGEQTASYETVSKTYRASTSAQSETITPSTGYDAIGEVNVSIPAVTQTNLAAANIKSGTTVTISNGSTNLWSVTGSYEGSGGGGSLSVDTKTVTASNYPVSISFSSMKGEPKYFFLRSTSQISSSGSTTYYYIIDMRYNGTNTTGNCFRIGSTRRVEDITSGYSWSYSGTTLTITSSAASRSASPGAFNNTYELVYLY